MAQRATATGSADFTCQRAVAASVVDNPVNGLRGDGGQVPFAEGPLFAHQAPSLGPVGFFESQAHFLSYFGNALEAVLHSALAADVRLEDFPVVDAVLARLAGVSDHHAALEFVEIHAQFDAMLTAGREFNGGGATKGRRGMILCFRGKNYEDGLLVGAYGGPSQLSLPLVRGTGERGA